MARRSYTQAPDCVVNTPLDQFKPGQLLCFKVGIKSGFYAHLLGKFLKLDRGLVVVHAQELYDPDWYDWDEFDRKYPGRIVRLRPTSCYLWGKSLAIKHWSDSYPHCHWFKDLNTPVA